MWVCGRVGKVRPYGGVQDIVHIVTQTVGATVREMSGGTKWRPTRILSGCRLLFPALYNYGMTGKLANKNKFLDGFLHKQ